MAFRDPRELMAAAGGVLPTDPRNERFPMLDIQPRGIGVEALQGIGGAFAAVQGEKVATLQAIREAQAKARAAELEYQREVEKMQKEQGLITDREKLKIASDEKLEQTKQAAENERALANAMIRGDFQYAKPQPSTLGGIDPTAYRRVPSTHYSYSTSTGSGGGKPLSEWRANVLSGKNVVDDIAVKAGTMLRITADSPFGSVTKTMGTDQKATPTQATALTEAESARQMLSVYSTAPRQVFEQKVNGIAAGFDEKAAYWTRQYDAAVDLERRAKKSSTKEMAKKWKSDTGKAAQTYRDMAAAFRAWPAEAEKAAIGGDGGMQTQTTSESVGVYGSSDDVIPDEMWKK